MKSKRVALADSVMGDMKSSPVIFYKQAGKVLSEVTETPTLPQNFQPTILPAAEFSDFRDSHNLHQEQRSFMQQWIGADANSLF